MMEPAQSSDEEQLVSEPKESDESKEATSHLQGYLWRAGSSRAVQFEGEAVFPKSEEAVAPKEIQTFKLEELAERMMRLEAEDKVSEISYHLFPYSSTWHRLQRTGEKAVTQQSPWDEPAPLPPPHSYGLGSVQYVLYPQIVRFDLGYHNTSTYWMSPVICEKPVIREVKWGDSVVGYKFLITDETASYKVSFQNRKSLRDAMPLFKEHIGQHPDEMPFFTVSTFAGATIGFLQSLPQQRLTVPITACFADPCNVGLMKMYRFIHGSPCLELSFNAFSDAIRIYFQNLMAVRGDCILLGNYLHMLPREHGIIAPYHFWIRGLGKPYRYLAHICLRGVLSLKAPGFKTLNMKPGDTAIHPIGYSLKAILRQNHHVSDSLTFIF